MEDKEYLSDIDFEQQAPEYAIKSGCILYDLPDYLGIDDF